MIKLHHLERRYPLGKEKFFSVLRDIAALTVAVVTILLGGIASAAIYVSALQATRVDPMIVLAHNT